MRFTLFPSLFCLFFAHMVVSAQTLGLSAPWDSDHFEHYWPDINGDGVPDTFLHAKEAGKQSFYVLSNKKAPSVDTKPFGLATTLDGAPWSAQQTKLVFADFTGDGKDDLLIFAWASQQAYLIETSKTGQLMLKNLHKNYHKKQFHWLSGHDDYVYHTGDFDGSGTHDLLALSQKPSGQHHLLLSDKNGALVIHQSFGQEAVWALEENYHLKIADFNSDGKDDVFALARNKNATHQYVVTKANGQLAVDTPSVLNNQLRSEDWNADDFSIMTYFETGKQHLQLLKMQNMQGGIDEEGVLWPDKAPEPLSEHQENTDYGKPLAAGEALKSLPACGQDYYFPNSGKQGKTCAPYPEKADVHTPSPQRERCQPRGTIPPSLARHERCDEPPFPIIPRTPSSAPSVSGGSFHPVNNTISVSMNTVPNGIYYELYESRNNANYRRVYRAHRNTSRTASLRYSRYGYVYYKYRACNYGGECGGYSPWRRIRVYTAPGGPPNFKATPTSIPQNGYTTLSWGASGGSVPGVMYHVHTTNPRGQVETNRTSQLSLRKRLSLAGTYRFKIVACNPRGTGCGGSRDASVRVIPPAPPKPPTPGKPTSSSYVRINKNYTVSWPAVSGTVSRYELYENDVRVYSSSGRSKTIKRSRYGRRLYKVRACNASGCSGYSQVHSVYIFTTTGYVNNLKATPNQVAQGGQVTVSWDGASGSVPGVTHRVRITSPQRTTTTTHTSARSIRQTLSSSGIYQFSVAACNPQGIGCGGSRSVSVTVIPSTPKPSTPGKPNSTSPYVPVNEEYTISWPGVSGTVSRYELYENDARVYSGSGRLKTIKRSRYGRRLYKVKACNASGCSNYSAVHPVVVYTAPGGPPNFKATPTSIPKNEQTTLSWSPSGGSVPGVEYRIRIINPQGATIETVSTDELSLSKTLSTMGVYQFKINACNPEGVGCSSPRIASVTVAEFNLLVNGTAVSEVFVGQGFKVQWKVPGASKCQDQNNPNTDLPAEGSVNKTPYSVGDMSVAWRCTMPNNQIVELQKTLTVKRLLAPTGLRKQ